LHLGKNRRENSLIAFTSKRHRSRLISVFCLRRHVTSTCSWMHASPCFIHIRSVVNANFDTVIAGGQYCGPNFKQRRLISFIPVKYTNRNLIKHCQCLDCSRPTGNNVKKYISASTRDVFAPRHGKNAATANHRSQIIRSSLWRRHSSLVAQQPRSGGLRGGRDYRRSCPVNASLIRV
jgi:hypothetical protein